MDLGIGTNLMTEVGAKAVRNGLDMKWLQNLTKIRLLNGQNFKIVGAKHL